MPMSNSIQRYESRARVMVPLRLLVGYGFMEHGFTKLSKGADTFAGLLLQLGVPM